MWGAYFGGGVIAAALFFGLALMVLAASFGHIPGVHSNSLVPIEVLIANEMQIIIAVFYVIMQLLGGQISLSFLPRLPNEGYFPFSLQVLLVTVILMVALDTKSKTGLAPVLIVSSGAYTGCSLNPARSLRPAIFANQWENNFIYWIGPLVGAIVAGFLYR